MSIVCDRIRPAAFRSLGSSVMLPSMLTTLLRWMWGVAICRAVGVGAWGGRAWGGATCTARRALALMM